MCHQRFVFLDQQQLLIAIHELLGKDTATGTDFDNPLNLLDGHQSGADLAGYLRIGEKMLSERFLCSHSAKVKYQAFLSILRIFINHCI